jgi:hypothetical protein
MVITVFCVSEHLIDSVCSEASKSSKGHFRIEHDISNCNLSPDDLPMDAPFQELMMEIIQKAEVTADSGHDTAGLSAATLPERRRDPQLLNILHAVL